MAKKSITNSQGALFATDVAERISADFDRKYDIRDTFTFRIMCGITGKSDDSVRAAIMLAMKKANSKKSNIKVRFTQEYANKKMEEIISLAKIIQLENEARILDIRSMLDDIDKKNGKKIAIQNYAMMQSQKMVGSSVKKESLNAALKATGDWYVPETSVFTLDLDFAGISSESIGMNIEKEIEIVSSSGDSQLAFRTITTVSGSKSCPVTEANKDEMADMLYDIMVAYDSVFNSIDGSDMDGLLKGLQDFTKIYRKHDNNGLIDTRLSEDEKKLAEEWASKAIKWITIN